MADLFSALRATLETEPRPQAGDLVPTAESRRLIGVAPSTALGLIVGFPAPVHPSLRGKPALYDRAAVLAYAANSTKRTTRAPRPDAGATDWAAALKRVRSGLDSIDMPELVLAAERERDNARPPPRHRCRRWTHLDTVLDARPDPRKLLKSEAVNRRLDTVRRDGSERTKREPVPITLPTR